LLRLEARQREVAHLQRCMARISGKKTEPIISILNTSGEEPAVDFGASLLDTRRELELLENHCKLQQIAIADARLLLRLAGRGLAQEPGVQSTEGPPGQPAPERHGE
ncbi:MAG: hypothetical protein KGS61_17715, partial [Verrucomicrobia bacterium]|nr:hypothetical protein [Verrucomicrobiota bacterium]